MVFLAEAAVNETGRGVFEDKAVKTYLHVNMLLTIYVI